MYKFHSTLKGLINFKDDGFFTNPLPDLTAKVVFSHMPIKDNEVFLFEISNSVYGCSMKFGVTLEKPANLDWLPNITYLLQFGKTELYRLKRNDNSPFQTVFKVENKPKVAD